MYGLENVYLGFCTSVMKDSTFNSITSRIVCGSAQRFMRLIYVVEQFTKSLENFFAALN